MRPYRRRQVVGWAGLLLQESPDAVRQQRTLPPAGGVYASYRFFGSPASRYDLTPTSHIVEVDSTPTPNLAAFLDCVRHKADGDVLRLKHIDLEGCGHKAQGLSYRPLPSPSPSSLPLSSSSPRSSPRRVRVTTIKLDLRYWPTYTLDRDGLEWRRHDMT